MYFEKLYMEWAALIKNENVLVNIYLLQIV